MPKGLKIMSQGIMLQTGAVAFDLIMCQNTDFQAVLIHASNKNLEASPLSYERHSQLF